MPTPHVYDKVAEKVEAPDGCFEIDLEDGTFLVLPPVAWPDGNKIEVGDRMLIDFNSYLKDLAMIKVFREHRIVAEFMVGSNCRIGSPALEEALLMGDFRLSRWISIPLSKIGTDLERLKEALVRSGKFDPRSLVGDVLLEIEGQVEEIRRTIED